MKDLLVRTALDARKVGASHSGSALLCPINPQQAAINSQTIFGGIKAAIAIYGTYDVVESPPFNSVGVSNNDFAKDVGFNDSDWYSFAASGVITILRGGICWIHMHAYGTVSRGDTNTQYMTSVIAHTRGGGAVNSTYGEGACPYFSPNNYGGYTDAAIMVFTQAGDHINGEASAMHGASGVGIAIRTEIIQIY